MLNIVEAILANPGYFKTLSVQDSLLVNYNCPQMETWADLYTDLNHIIYTIEGTRTFVRPEKSVEVNKGSLIFLRKSAFQQGKFHDETWQVIVFAVHDNYFKKFISEYRSQLFASPGFNGSKRETLFEVSTNDTIEAYFYSIIPYFNQQPPPNENLLELKLKELIFHILFDKANASLLSYISTMVNDRKASFIETMEANYMYNLSLTEFSKLTHHSLTAFKKEFAEIFNTAPGKWLLQKRLELACKLLQTSEKAVHDIAWGSGFESVTHFNRAFRERYGTTPLEYRRR